MSAMQIAVLVIVVLVLAAVAAGAWTMMRRRSLRERFGPEYDRTVSERDSRREGERELRERERRHDELELRELSADSRARYSEAWEKIQTHFVDDPNEALAAADKVVITLLAEVGYPTDDYDERLAQLSVDHARTLAHYRAAQEINRQNQVGNGSTEQLRQAMVHYRAFFAEVLGEQPRLHTRRDPTPRDESPRDTTPHDVTPGGASS
jgi:hypothetical protein